jgi:hypothetical protein
MERAALLILLLVAGLACSSSNGKPADPAAPAPNTAQAAPPTDRPRCDWKIVPLSDPGQKQIQCANGESFVVRRGEDGQWHEEMKVRAGLVPGYATPEEAARARCCAASGPS